MLASGGSCAYSVPAAFDSILKSAGKVIKRIGDGCLAARFKHLAFL